MLLYGLIYLLVSFVWLGIFSAVARGLKFTTMLAVFGAGAVVAIPVGYLSGALRELLPNYTAGIALREFLLYFLVVGPVEEGGKFLAAFLVAFRKRDFASTLDGVLIAIAAGLGFAALENLLYLSMYGVSATLPRLILGNLGHAAFSVFWGYAFGIVLIEDAPASGILWGLVLAALLHGAYNFLLTVSVYVAPLALVLSAVLYWFMLRLIRSERGRSAPRS